MTKPLISICMPVYNAAAYIGEAIESVLQQTYENYELIICDNCSTDSSAQIAKHYAELSPKIKFFQNQWNVGFSGNAHKVTSLAKGDFLLLHAADDVSAPYALETYVEIINQLGQGYQRLVLMSDFYVIDQQGRMQHIKTSDNISLKPVGHEDQTSGIDKVQFIKYSGGEVLELRLPRLATFGLVGTILFSRDLLISTEGYASNQWINPDKHFMFKILSLDPMLIWAKKPLFYYRVHTNNQNSQQTSTGILKYLLDEYAYTFDLPKSLLDQYANGRDTVVNYFIEYDCLRAALREIANGNRKTGFRYVCFGLATYPEVALRNLKSFAVLFLWALGPVGTHVASFMYKRLIDRNSRKTSKR